MSKLLSDAEVIDRILGHIDNKTTDRGEAVWREPVENYLSTERFAAELELLRRVPVPFCPSAAIAEPGAYVARRAAGRPLLAVRDDDGIAHVFRNVCRHRGMTVAEGCGSARAFVCPYHAWTYSLDGKLKHIPDADGFPDVVSDEHGLVPVHAEERGGLIFVTQDEPISEGALTDMPDLVTADQIVFDTTEFIDEANWKVIGETSMEGYHIKALHTKTFYPYGFDNLNVVETYGANSRITFPFRRIEKLRDLPRESRRIEGMVTYVYQLFPNTHISVLSNHSLFVILEPLSPTRTQWVIYRLTNAGVEADLKEAQRDADFVKTSGLQEDRDAACGIQAGLESGANTHLTFGHYEQAISYFHARLDEHLAKLGRVEPP